MGAFIVSAIVEVLTILACVVMAFANGMSDSSGQNNIPVLPTFICGTVIAAAIFGTHYLPHIGW